jgi:hypothetical protein
LICTRSAVAEVRCSAAMSLSACQNMSSRLMLVLRPVISTERLVIPEFISRISVRSHRESGRTMMLFSS